MTVVTVNSILKVTWKVLFLKLNLPERCTEALRQCGEMPGISDKKNLWQGQVVKVCLLWQQACEASFPKTETYFENIWCVSFEWYESFDDTFVVES